MLNSHTVLAAAAIGIAAWATQASAQAGKEFEAPPNSLALDDTGAVEAIQGNYVKFRDSKENVWLLELQPQTVVAIEGEVGADYLRPGLTVEITGSVNDKLTLDEPIEQLDVYSSKGRQSFGLFNPDDETEGAKPLKNPEVGKYRIRGKVASAKDGQMMIVAGRFKISGKLGDEVKVKLNLDDARSAKFGDSMKVKAWYYDTWKPNPAAMRPGKAIAEEVKITLSEPTEGKTKAK